MNNCKNCIYNKVCISRICYDENFGDSSKLNYNCADFEDIETYIKLPCKVGDKYYKIRAKCSMAGYYDNEIQCATDYCDEDCDYIHCDRKYYIEESEITNKEKLYNLLSFMESYEKYGIDSLVYFDNNKAKEKIEELKARE